MERSGLGIADRERAKRVIAAEHDLGQIGAAALGALIDFWSQAYDASERWRALSRGQAKALLLAVAIGASFCVWLTAALPSSLGQAEWRWAAELLLFVLFVSALVAAVLAAAQSSRPVTPWLHAAEAAALAGSDEAAKDYLLSSAVSEPYVERLRLRRAAELYVAAGESRQQAHAASITLRVAEALFAAAVLVLLAAGLGLGALSAAGTTNRPTPTGAETPPVAVTPSPEVSEVAVLSPTPRMNATPTLRTTEAPAPSLPEPTACPAALIDGTVSTIRCVLPLVPVAAGPGPGHPGYSRNLFRHWIDEDHNGCNTRQEVLLRDAAIAPIVGSSCTLSGGQWFSQYDGQSFTDGARLDIDHVVPLAEAWDSGASIWDTPLRQSYANDLGVGWALLAVSASSNRSKSDRDPAEWLDVRREFVCEYLADWLAVKVRWELSIDDLEKAAIAANRDCSDATVEIVLARR